MAAVHDQRILVGVAEKRVVPALGIEYAEQAGRASRYRDLAVRMGEHRQRYARQCRLGHLKRGLIRVVAGAVVDAHRYPLARGHADESLAQCDFGAHP